MARVGVSVTNSELVPCLLSLTHFCKVDTVTPSAGAVLLPKDAEAQRPDRIHLCGPPLHAPLQTPWAPLLIIPHPPVINACLLQQVKPFQFEEGRNYVKEKCNYSGLQPASFRLKDEDSQKQRGMMRVSRVLQPLLETFCTLFSHADRYYGHAVALSLLRVGAHDAL
ncbi:hypothetical protein QQF64_002875 [Cirrhinus molitorella]|uniref:Uncharacterized protein n=1 Tax=Cirrhinus molitorella TaxID=172907 RepID=A0ABR3MRF6_9TELE